MFEFDKYDRNLHKDPPASPSTHYEQPVDIEGMSLLLWGEHCVECAAPACYSTCDLYEPRLDSTCSRFSFGAYKNRSFPSIRGYGTEIFFKKWAKIEAFGNTAIYPIRSVRRQTDRNTPARGVLDTLGVRACAVEEDGFAEGMLLRVPAPLTRDFIRIKLCDGRRWVSRVPVSERGTGFYLTLVRSARKMLRSQCRRHVS